MKREDVSSLIQFILNMYNPFFVYNLLYIIFLLLLSLYIIFLSI